MRKPTRALTPFVVALGLLLALVLVLAQPTYANTYTVNSTDDADNGTCDTSHCSLREAIGAANANPGPDTITFDPSLAGQTIAITTSTSPLTIQGANSISTTIDGDVNGDNIPDITLAYSGASSGITGLRIRSSGNVIQNLIIQAFTGHGIYLQGASYTVNDILISNTTVISNGYYGIYIKETEGARIVNSRAAGNDYYGIRVDGATNTQVEGNLIGLAADGSTPQPNQLDGLYLDGAVTTTVRGNTISGNRRNGILVGGGAHGNVIAGNKIGTNSAGTAAVPNGTGYSSGRDGIQCSGGGGYDNTIGGLVEADANIIGGNTRAGIFFDGSNCHSNRIFGNYIGTNPTGADLGNGSYTYGGDAGDAGIEIEDGAHDNLIGFTDVNTTTGRANIIRYNYHGVRLSGFNGPPQNNRLISNTITGNDNHGVINQLTHRNTVSTTPSLGDNLLAHNAISGNNIIGILNWGASPHILTNTIVGNGDFGIANRVYFSETNHAADLLAIPYIAGNLLDGNGNDDIFSRDTNPLNKATLHLDNDFGIVGGDARVSQRWFGAVEVLSNTATITGSANLTITITTYAASRTPCPVGPCRGTAYAQASATPEQGIWGPTGIDYVDVENADGTTTWFELREYEVDETGQVITYSKMLVGVEGDYIGSTVFSYDGISTTDPVTPDHQLPFCEMTGILSDPTHSLCRYQIAQVVIQPPGGDADGDGIPDDEEGAGDADGDGTPDYLDNDSDNDGIPDDVEGTDDADGDTTPNYLDTDSDNDTIPDEVEAGPDPTDPIDSDGDGTPDYLDTDSDNDGIPDGDEAGADPQNPSDTDGDGIPDYIESNVEDADGDGSPNYNDTDSDGDTISDDDEYYSGESDDPLASNCTLDTDNDGVPNCRDNDVDGDGIPNYLDGDSDGDGIPDAQEGTDDDDADGVPNWLDDDGNASQGGDSDGDGLSDAAEYYAGPADTAFCTNTTLDTDNDGVPNCQDNDVDGDSIPNYLDTDADGDGTTDAQEPAPPTTNDPPFQHGDVPAWIDPVYHIYLPVVLRSFGP